MILAGTILMVVELERTNPSPTLGGEVSYVSRWRLRSTSYCADRVWQAATLIKGNSEVAGSCRTARHIDETVAPPLTLPSSSQSRISSSPIDICDNFRAEHCSAQLAVRNSKTWTKPILNAASAPSLERSSTKSGPYTQQPGGVVTCC